MNRYHAYCKGGRTGNSQSIVRYGLQHDVVYSSFHDAKLRALLEKVETARILDEE